MPTVEQVLRYLNLLFPGQLVLYPPQVAQVLGKSEKALQHLIDRATLPFEGKKIGSRWCVDVFRVAEWMASDSEGVSAIQENPTSPPEKPTRARRASTRQGLGSKLLEMRQAAATAMRRAVDSGDVLDAAVVGEFIQALLQPVADDQLELHASLVPAEGGDTASERVHETFETLAGAAERVADLRSRPEVGSGTVRVSRSGSPVYECALEANADWRAVLECDVRFAALLGLIEHQAQQPRFVADFSDPRVPADWLARQSRPVRREVQSLCALGVDAGFFTWVAAAVPLVQEVTLLVLYHDAWCLPSKRVLELAIAHRWTADALTRCVDDAEVALITPDAVADFELFFPLDAEPDAAVCWLREYAYRSRLH